MSANQENAWLGALRRHAGIRTALVVSGNVNDVCYCDDTQDYRPVPEVVAAALHQRGFDEVVLWDRFSGVQNVSVEAAEALQREVVPDGQSNEAPAGEAYDVDEGEAAPASPQTTDAPVLANPDDFYAVAYHHLMDPGSRRRAFVIDYSHLLFGSATNLSEQERQWLIILSKAVRNAPMPLAADELDRSGSLLVLICNRIECVPPVFYQNNPRVHEITIPMPARAEREAFLRRTQHLWLLRQPLTPGDADFNDFVDCLEGLHLRDLQQLVRLSRQVEGEPLTSEKLIGLYKYGEQNSPWEELSRAKLDGIEETLRRWVKGQDEAVDKVRDVIVRAYTGLSGLQHSRRQSMPKGVLFFVGPTGVGKTELAKALARFLFGDETACQRFDMSEYNHEHSDLRLVGAPPSYVGYEAGGQLTNAVKARPFSVLLFDEIEKAHPRILDKFLQILEDGRLTDGKGETVYFSETVIIFTSNIGAAQLTGHSQDEPERVKELFTQEVRRHFVEELGRPELLNRIGNNIVPFNFINGDQFLVDIARAKLSPLQERLREKYRIEELAFADEERALAALVSRVNRANGGRGVLTEIVTSVIDPLADFLFREEEDFSHYAGRRIRVVQAGDSAQFAFTLE